MKNPTNLTIAVLCVLAVVLGTAVYFVHTTPAYANDVSPAGDYIMFTGAVSAGTDMLYVIDTAEQKLNVYEIGGAKTELTFRDQVNLQQLFAK